MVHGYIPCVCDTLSLLTSAKESSFAHCVPLFAISSKLVPILRVNVESRHSFFHRSAIGHLCGTCASWCGEPRWQKQYRTSEKHSKTRVFGSDQKHWKTFLPSRIQRLTQKHSKHWKTFLPSIRAGNHEESMRLGRRSKGIRLACPSHRNWLLFWLFLSEILSRQSRLSQTTSDPAQKSGKFQAKVCVFSVFPPAKIVQIVAAVYIIAKRSPY